MNFSQRIGLEPATKALQKNSMDRALRNSLWNAFDMWILPWFKELWRMHGGVRESREEPHALLLVPLWVDFFKWDLSSLPQMAFLSVEHVHKWFFDEQHTPWNRIYDFVDFVAALEGPPRLETEPFVEECNRVLEREFSAYRFINDTLCPITNDAEIKAIEEAASLDTSVLRPVSQHIDTAIKLLGDRQNPDYRNSMKESISAVEAICKIIAQNDKTTLGPALDAVTARTNLHPRLQDGFKALYGYTSDTHGIRHALKDEKEPEAEDAMFFLVSCSAFVNYLVEKARKSGLLPQ